MSYSCPLPGQWIRLKSGRGFLGVKCQLRAGGLRSFTRRAASRFLNKPPIVSGLAAYSAAGPQLWAWPASTDRTFQQKLLLFGKFLGQHCFSPDDCLSYVIRTRRKKRRSEAAVPQMNVTGESELKVHGTSQGSSVVFCVVWWEFYRGVGLRLCGDRSDGLVSSVICWQILARPGESFHLSLERKELSR